MTERLREFQIPDYQKVESVKICQNLWNDFIKFHFYRYQHAQKVEIGEGTHPRIEPWEISSFPFHQKRSNMSSKENTKGDVRALHALVRYMREDRKLNRHT